MTLWLLPLIPLAGAAALLVLRRGSLLPWLALTPLVIVLGVGVWASATQPTAAWDAWGPRLHPQLAVTGISRILVVLVPIIAIPVVLYAAASSRSQTSAWRLLALLVAFTGAMELLAVASDFLTLLVAWELVGACSWALIGFEWRDPVRPRAALNAFITTRTGDVGLYLAAAATVATTGSLQFEAIGQVPTPVLHVIAAGVLVAAAAKSAQLPFSPWLFSAMAGPTAASALLHSATMVAAGAFLLVRLAPLFAPTGWFLPTVAWLGLATALAGGVVASVQTDLKKALAASTSAQYGLMLIAIGAGFGAAATVHLITHAAFKALLFLCAGIALHAAGTLDLGQLRLGIALPRVARLFAVAALSLAAVPPLGGAYSKEQILAAAAQAPFGARSLVVGVLIAGFLSAFYAARLYVLAFGSAPSRAVHAPTAVERSSITLLGALSLGLGVLWIPWGHSWVEEIAGALPPEGPLLFAVSLASVAAAGGLCWFLWVRGRLLDLSLPVASRAWAAGWFGLPTLGRRAVVSPALQFSRALAVVDDRVVDRGIRLAVRVPRTLSALACRWVEAGFERIVTGTADLTRSLAAAASRWGEQGMDSIVTLVADLTTWSAAGSRTADDDAIDAVVEGVAHDVGTAGVRVRGWHTGLAHHYYAMLAAGALGVFAIAAFWR